MKFWALAPLVACLFSLQAFATAPRKTTRPQILLSYAQFSHLTNAEQKTYIKKLREVMEEMSKAFPEFAQEMSARSSFFAQMWNSNFPAAYGEANPLASFDIGKLEKYIREMDIQAKLYLDDIANTNPKKLSEENQDLYVEKYRQALFFAASAETTARHIPDKKTGKYLLTRVINPTRKRVEELEAKVKPFGEIRYSQARDDYFKKAHEDNFDLNTPYPLDARVPYGERLQLQKPDDLPPIAYTKDPKPNLNPTVKVDPNDKLKLPTTPRAFPKSDSSTVGIVSSENVSDMPPIPQSASNSEGRPPPPQLITEDQKSETPPTPKVDAKKEDQPVPKAASSEETTGTAKSKKPDFGFYRCMYAGFVIKKGPDCKGPSSLPWDLEGLDTETFVCENGSIMCNPFLFGFKSSCKWDDASENNKTDTCMSSAKPYCVSKGVFATKNCSSISTSDNALQAAVQLSHKNPKAFDLFQTSFEELCDKGLIDFNGYEGKRKEKTKEDILRTCAVAQIRMDALKLHYLIPKETDKIKQMMPAAEKAIKNNKTAQ
ncbi:MAG TPA: hypothetical protein VIG33_16540 [Pseudobdellovibrionaceae bacterium]|jgi:hypothetical protein